MPIDLPLSKMFEMLPLPAKVSRDLFLKSKHLTDSGEKTVAEMTVKELRGVVRRERELAGLLPRKDSPASDPPSGHATDSTTDPFKALDLPEGYAEVLEKLPVCVARMLIPLSRDERLAMLDVAAQLSSLAFSENYPEILHSVRQNNSPSSIAASYKAPPKRQPMSGIFIDPYEILHVDECEDERVVRSKYRTLVKQLHPDVGGSDFLFKLVHEAWKDYQCSEY
ncbi:J domain-containing protein [Paenibacillus pinihumi]|uniref:J domain-containing protein n=1 Tax=Paenibacillus pinihumi TaxID=669462 RepID=UPI0012B52C7C|nr:J domain-containing protein [Paenibacillus pinihumi]